MGPIIISSIIAFTFVIIILVLILLYAQSKLVQSGDVKIIINGDEESALVVSAGSSLLSTLGSKKIFLPSACGGGGTCAQCRCRVLAGGGSILSTEEGHFTRGEIRDDWRLSCQVAVKQDLKIEIPEDAIGVKRWECEVTSNPNVATFIKELNLKLPEGEDVAFKAGGYVQLEIPPYEMQYKEIDVEEEYHGDWDRFNVWDNFSKVDETTIRAYSMANYPDEKGILKFNIRIASPPPGMNVPAGKMSSYVFNLKAGDKLTVFGADLLGSLAEALRSDSI